MGLTRDEKISRLSQELDNANIRIKALNHLHEKSSRNVRRDLRFLRIQSKRDGIVLILMGGAGLIGSLTYDFLYSIYISGGGSAIQNNPEFGLLQIVISVISIVILAWGGSKL